MTEQPRDEIDELVDWQLAQGRHRGLYPTHPPATRTVAHSKIAALPPPRPGWLSFVRQTLRLGGPR